MSYAGMATNIIGGELQGWAAVLDKMAMADQLRQEQARQNAYRTQALGQFNQNLPTFGSANAEKQIGAGQQDRMKQYQGLQKTPLGFTAPGQNNSRTSGQITAMQDVSNRGRSANAGYGDWQFGQNMAGVQNARPLNQLLSFAKGTAGVFPYRMYQAQHSMDDLAMMGQAISSIGGGSADFSQYARGPQPNQSQGGFNGGFQDAYGNNYPNGWTQMGGDAEGTMIAG